MDAEEEILGLDRAALDRARMSRDARFDGNNGFATGTNNRRQTVGWAENTVRDPTCNAAQVLQFRAAVWGPERDQIRELPPLPGDTVTAATAINDRGQVVGISGICANAVGQFKRRPRGPLAGRHRDRHR